MTDQEAMHAQQICHEHIIAEKDAEIARLKAVAFQAQNAAIDLANKLKAIEDIAKGAKL